MNRPRFWLAVLALVVSGGAQALDLMEAYQLALESDPVLKQAEENLNAVRETRPQAKALLLPNVGISGRLNQNYRDITDSPFPVEEGSENFSTSNLSINLLQPIYNRAYWMQLEQADSVIAQAEAEYAAAKQDLMARTIEAYFNVLAAQDDLTVAKAKKEANLRQLDQAKQRFEVGLIAITDVHEAQAAYDGSRADVIATENKVNNAWEALFVIIGPHPGKLSKLAEKIPLNKPEPADLDEWAKVALEQNYSIVAARSALEAQRKTVEIQRSGHYPQLDLVGSYSLDTSGAELGRDSNTGVIGLQLNLPLYQGGAVSSRTRQALYNYQATKESLDSLRRSINQQVRNAYRGVITSISQVEALKATTVSAQSALESTQAGYEVGTRTLVDVLTVQGNMFAARRNYLAARYDYIINGLLLKQAASTLSEDDMLRVNKWLVAP
ncbi:MAG TPA: type I secretion protein TolC [Sedimenticola thiotaurini]|uniref:Type I secretion protein TolC n=1 Tax=Sedimenticola thiotaurini TaxID=1543721 RepID=A0A831RKQ4_9GAMM|nr:type I secretion protein TolC [Sedimenticola thiotaurini]